jgi:crossover junction endodeoxyribonuclease RuvC
MFIVMSITDPRSKVFAIDPGINGAWAVLGFAGEFLGAGEIPRFPKLINGVEFASLVRSYAPEQVVIERVHAMPKQGVTSVFTFGAAYGVCIGIACGTGTPISYVTPHRWKSHFRLMGTSKNASREKAIQLFPGAHKYLSLQKHHGRADALLLARFFLDMETRGETP